MYVEPRCAFLIKVEKAIRAKIAFLLKRSIRGCNNMYCRQLNSCTNHSEQFSTMCQLSNKGMQVIPAKLLYNEKIKKIINKIT